MSGSAKHCSICGTSRRWVMCDDCVRLYERDAHNDDSVFEAMRWAAQRARLAAVKRERDRAAHDHYWRAMPARVPGKR
jgi:hypothetical protein